MSAVSGNGPVFQRRRNSIGLTSGKKDDRVPMPRVLVEVDGQEPAGLVGQQGIDAHGEVLAVRVPAAEMSADDFIGHRYEGAVRTFPALDPRLVADARRPLVGTGRCVTRPAAPRVRPSPREYVVAASKERPKQRDLLGRRRRRRYGWRATRRAVVVRVVRADLGEPLPQRGLFGGQRRQSLPDRCRFFPIRGCGRQLHRLVSAAPCARRSTPAASCWAWCFRSRAQCHLSASSSNSPSTATAAILAACSAAAAMSASSESINASSSG